MDVEALIGETAAIVATGYASLDVSNAAGLLLDSRYEGEAWQLMPLALELTTVHAHVGRDGEQRELGEPAFDPASDAVAKCEALNDALCAADDGWVRIEDYWLALASELHARLSVPVLVDEVEMPIAEQLRRQRHAAPAADAFEVLIDQPEDDLDSRSVYDVLVEYLKARKVERQIIMVGHNANLVVGADTEQVLVANRHGSDRRNDNDRIFDYLSGSLEHSRPRSRHRLVLMECGIREHACGVLDGGEEAFLKRQQKYRLT